MRTLRHAAPHTKTYHQCTQTYVDWGTTHTHTHTHMYSMLYMQNSRHQIPHRGAAPRPFQSTLCPRLHINDELVADQRKLIKMFWASINYSQSILLFYARWTFTSGSRRTFECLLETIRQEKLQRNIILLSWKKCFAKQFFFFKLWMSLFFQAYCSSTIFFIVTFVMCKAWAKNLRFCI